MKKKISDMMDYIQDDSVNIQIKNIASSQKILEATRSKLHTDRKIHDTDNIIPRPVRRFSAALIAAVLILSLSVTAFAYVGFVAYENPVAMLNAFFGENIESKSDGVIEYNENGELAVALPGWERVPVDTTLADELISQYISSETSFISWDGYTLSVEANLYDSHTQSGLLYYSIENPAGITGYLVRGQNTILFQEGSISFCPCLSGDGWSGEDYLDATRSTDTKIYVCRYYVGSEGLTENKQLGNLELQVRSNIDGEILGSVVLNNTNERNIACLSVADGNIVISPIGIRIYNAKLGYKTVNDINSIILHYNDGTEYVVLDNAGMPDHFTDNTTYGLLDSVSDPARVTFTFNRLVDINSLSSVIINGTIYDTAK